MKWAHLPIEGGVYDQHPDLLEQWDILFELEAKEKQRQMDKNNPKPRRNIRNA